ncbi:MAG: AAA family ATPase [Mariprofundaceae bacterium]
MMNHDARVAMLSIGQQLEGVLTGNQQVIEQVLVTLICGGHLLLEGMPGLGKTTLAHGLASSLHASFGRIQFTADLLPADILGVDIFNPVKREFEFHQGAIFHHVVLADEINRATPRAQSALLEAMAEGQVSVERGTRALPQPFFVLATQNPQDHVGTFPLPESQLDRFFMRLSLDYPDTETERKILLDQVGRAQLSNLEAVATLDDVMLARGAVSKVVISEPLMDYLLKLLQESRNNKWLKVGVSPRAGRDLLAAARARAWLQGKDYVCADDVQQQWIPSVAHRVTAQGDTSDALMALLESVPVPG